MKCMPNMKLKSEVRKMRLGPLSSDLIVGCAIYSFKVKGTDGVEIKQIEEILDPLVSKSTIHRSLGTLEEWGVTKIVFTRSAAGRPARLFSVSGESEGMIKETYHEFWEKIQEKITQMRAERTS